MAKMSLFTVGTSGGTETCTLSKVYSPVSAQTAATPTALSMPREPASTKASPEMRRSAANAASGTPRPGGTSIFAGFSPASAR